MYVQNVLDQFELKLIQILLRPEKKTYSRMAIGRNDNYVQRTFTADAFRKRRKREKNSTVGPKLTFPPQQQKWHNRTTVLYTKYVRNTKNYFPPEPKKKLHNTTTVWNSKYLVVCTTKTYFPPKRKTDTTAQLEKRFLQPTRSKCTSLMWVLKQGKNYIWFSYIPPL